MIDATHIPGEMIPLAEQLSLAEAAKLMRGRGRRQHPAVETVRRWANPNRGCTAGSAKLVLRSVRIGGDVITCAAWVEEFERARMTAGRREQPPPPARTIRQRRLAHERAERNLDAAGIGVPKRKNG